MGKEAAVTYSTGFQVNLGVVGCLGFRGGFIFLDALDHACIIDGSRLSFSDVRKFRHNDMADLERKLFLTPRNAPKLIVVDGVYSMEGDIAPLPEIVKLAKKYKASVMVDDAHGLGETDLIMGTFSKSFGSLGGFIAGDFEVIDYLKHNSRSLIFSASMTPAAVAAASKALDIMIEEPERRENLWKVTRYAQEAFKNAGFDTGHTQSPIIPLFVRDTIKAMTIVPMAYKAGVFITPVIAPAVPEKDVLIRFALMATHTTEQVDEAASASSTSSNNFLIWSSSSPASPPASARRWPPASVQTATKFTARIARRRTSCPALPTSRPTPRIRRTVRRR